MTASMDDTNAKTKPRRAHGEGSIFFHEKLKQWVGVISLGTDGAGKRIRRTVYGDSKTAVREKLDAAKALVAAGVVEPSKDTVRAYVERWLEDTVRTTTRVSTYDTYKRVLQKHVLPYLGHYPLAKLAPDHVQGLLRHMESKGASVRLRQLAFAVLRAAINLAVERAAIVRSPMAGVRAPVEETERKARYLTQEQVRHLVGSLDGWLKRFVFLDVVTGARHGELLALRWSDLDPVENVVSISRTMLELRVPVVAGETSHGDKWRIVHREAPVKSKVIPVRRVSVPESVMGMFRTEWKERKLAGTLDALVFTNRSGGALIQNNVRRSFLAAVRAAQLPRMKIHELRHTSATLLLASGENPKVVQERLGHSKVGVTLDIYSHVPREVDRKAAERLGEMVTVKEEAK